jgi:glycosyltransferase involved in cell wall biosynthesis
MTYIKNPPASPLVSVVMPVYNGKKFLCEAIDSILKQTYRNFELIIIDDGSTDNSSELIGKYSDERIRFHQNKTNRGIVYSLNKGIELASGKYIARMDADDVSLPHRLQKQVAYLETNPQCIVLSSYIDLMDEKGEPLLPWFAERAARTPEQIYKMMVDECCIAHPSVMMRAGDLPKPTYLNVPGAEDWDLWLRVLRKGPVIHKIVEPLVKYRVHDSSITQNLQKGPDAFKQRIRYFYLGYLFRALRSLCIDSAAKCYLRKALTFPIRSARRYIKTSVAKIMICYLRLTMPKTYANADSHKIKISIAAPWLVVGGADHVVVELANGLSKTHDTSVILTERSSNPWLSRVASTCRLHLLRNFLPSQAKLYEFTRAVLSNNTSVLIISNSPTAYESLPIIRMYNPSIKVIDIIHGQGGAHERGGMVEYAKGFKHLIDHRVTVSKYLAHYLRIFYREQPKRISTIYNGIVPPRQDRAKKTETFDIVWVGRFSEEKQPAIALRAFATLPRPLRNHSRLILVGDGILRRDLEQEARTLGICSLVVFTGYQSSGVEYISKANCLLITSEMEGLPIVMIEAIHCNTPIIATAVGGIPELVNHGVNGYLVPFNEKTPDMMAKYIRKISKWHDQHSRRYNQKLSRKLTSDHMVQQYEGLIQKVAKNLL